VLPLVTSAAFGTVLFSPLFVCLSAGSRKQLCDVHKILETGRVSTREEMIKSDLQHSPDILSHSQTVQIIDVKTERGLGKPVTVPRGENPG